MLKITAIGNLTHDVELKMNENTGKPYAILRIASDRRYKDTSLRWQPSQRSSPSVMRSLQQRSIWRPDCLSPASDGRKMHSGTICSGTGER